MVVGKAWPTPSRRIAPVSATARGWGRCWWLCAGSLSLCWQCPLVQLLLPGAAGRTICLQYRSERSSRVSPAEARLSSTGAWPLHSLSLQSLPCWPLEAPSRKPAQRPWLCDATCGSPSPDLDSQAPKTGQPWRTRSLACDTQKVTTCLLRLGLVTKSWDFSGP